MEILLQDLRYGIRMLRKSPGFSAVVILTLALGIGANTALFSVVDAILLRPLPFRQPEQLVSVKEDLPGVNLTNAGMSQPELDDFQRRSGVFDQISAVNPINANITGREKPLHYLQRFWECLPEHGQIVVFDRSWYGRVLVERVEAYATPTEWRRAYNEINDFERMLLETTRGW